jgi:hypothetical protein
LVTAQASLRGALAASVDLRSASPPKVTAIRAGLSSRKLLIHHSPERIAAEVVAQPRMMPRKNALQNIGVVPSLD